MMKRKAQVSGFTVVLRYDSVYDNITAVTTIDANNFTGGGTGSGKLKFHVSNSRDSQVKRLKLTKNVLISLKNIPECRQTVNKCQNLSRDILGYLLTFEDIFRHFGISVEILGYFEISVDISGHFGIFVDI